MTVTVSGSTENPDDFTTPPLQLLVKATTDIMTFVRAHLLFCATL